ncbi:hypothetical protein DFH08DRAFT_957700 [Mycena albidolilacea]|uniref:DUF6533 domain-containing protein n=1 Tax=Mycena albidolilacea TaxID=1033008 RepID=A0AAD7A7N0_9AGAR|nr:hypothetical protein DFH08DRAFT_957700 [Mycena albidolilacea]
MVWDHIITLGDERELFWKRRPWTLATCLFLWIRYVGILLTAFGVFVILQLRIYALYDASPRIAALIVGAFAVEILAVIGMFGVGSNHIEAVAEAVGNMVRCKATVVPSWLWLLWIPATSFELLLCVLAVYKGYQRFRTIGHQVLHDILVRDSVMYYLAIQCVYIYNLIYWVNDAKTSLEVLTALAIALPSVMGSRLMINVRLALIPPTTLSEISLGEISFPGPSNNPDSS